jgi:hypothetical protein
MNEAQRQEFLDQSRAHYAADMLIQGTYGEKEGGTFRGCSVGCHLMHIGPERDHGPHATVAGHYGYPEWLAHLQDNVFEGLPDDECNRWHLQLAEALYDLPDNYDWQAARHRGHAAILRVALQHAGTAASVVQTVIGLHERAARGEAVSDEDWAEAARAARAAEAAAGATWAAREAAARAARAAEAAAGATWAAREAAEAATWAAREAAARAARAAGARAARAAGARAARAAGATWAARAAAEAAAYQQIRDGVLAALAQTGEKS